MLRVVAVTAEHDKARPIGPPGDHSTDVEEELGPFTVPEIRDEANEDRIGAVAILPYECISDRLAIDVDRQRERIELREAGLLGQ